MLRKARITPGLGWLCFFQQWRPPQQLQRKPADLPEQGPDAFAEVFPQQAGDANINNMLTWLNIADGTDTIPNVCDSPSLTTFVHELPDLRVHGKGWLPHGLSGGSRAGGEQGHCP